MITPIANRALFVALLALVAPAHAERIQADLKCSFTGIDFVYDCVIRLQPPKSGVRISVGADMPSMPMAHNVKPVKAAPTNQPGEYTARIELEMHGEWALKLNVRSPVRDVIVKKIDFRERP